MNGIGSARPQRAIGQDRRAGRPGTATHLGRLKLPQREPTATVFTRLWTVRLAALATDCGRSMTSSGTS